MRAVVYDSYGSTDVLRLAEMPLPRIGADEVRVRVHATAVNPKDTFIRKGRFKLLSGMGFPKRIGFDFAGVVDETGVNVHHVTKGERVYGHLDSFMGGAAAEYVKVPRTKLAALPESLDFTQAAGLSLVTQTALQALRDEGNIQPGMRVCINGASGGVGSAAIQIARISQAHITAISSARNHAFCRELGADETLDYTTTDITRSDDPFDIFFDVFGNHTYDDILPILCEGGVYVSTVPSTQIVLQQTWTGFFAAKKARLVTVRSNTADLNTISSWIKAGEYRPIIDSVYTLDEIAAAHARQETKHARGKIIVRVDHPANTANTDADETDAS